MLTSLLAVVVCLDGLWDFRFARDRTLEGCDPSAFVATDKMIVPGCWDVQTRYFNQRGTGLYRRRFTLAEACAEAFLVVDGVGIRSRYWLDGREIGSSVSPWARLEFRTGPLAAGEHELVAAVDSVVDNAKVKLFWDFYDFAAFGGFYHGVRLETAKAPDEIRRVVVRTRDWRTGLVELEAFHVSDGPSDFTARVSFDGAPGADVAFTNRRARLHVPNPTPWSPEAPNLHWVSVDGATARFGIRQVGTARKRITLNGRPVYLRGVNRHEAHAEFGAATSRQLIYEDLANIRALGGNFVRGAHYPQCEAFLDLCDEMGILVWEESLGWGNTARQLEDAEFRRLQVEETRRMVRASINHPSVILTGFLNEPDSYLPACKSLVEELVAAVRAEDTGHLVTFACHRPARDIAHEKTDVIAYNAYPGWYSYQPKAGTAEEMRRSIAACHGEIVARFREKYGDERPILVSESGVKADYGAHDPRGRAQYTEDYQAEYTRAMLEEVFANPEIAGIAIWQYSDAKTYTRRHAVHARSYGVNTGGLYDLYRRPKMAVDVVRELFWASRAKEPISTDGTKMSQLTERECLN